MTQALLLTIPCSLIIGFIIQAMGIKLAHQWNLLDVPDIRRRHAKPVPLIGGSGILLTWLGSFFFYFTQDQSWLSTHHHSMVAIGIGVSILWLLGLVDDLYGLDPRPKFFFQIVATLIVITFEPSVHEVCLHWQEIIGPVVWILAILWIVGVTNAINLVDGLDGLAGGTVFLVSCSILTLSIWTGQSAFFATIMMSLLAPSIIPFLKNNWNPAKIFLGDNGSLPLGFMLAITSLMCRAQNKSWIMVASLILMLGYPILDTGLASLRRFRKGLPIFKADRNHLHFRILRLGLSVKQTALLLLSISFYLQITALCINLMDPAPAAIALALVSFSIFSLLLIISGIERWRISRLFAHLGGKAISESNSVTSREFHVLTIELEPLLETGMAEEKARYRDLIFALQIMIKSNIRIQDLLLTSNQRISVILSDFDGNEELTITRFKDKIQTFLTLFNFQCSLSSLPVKIEKRSLLIKENALSQPLEILDPKKQSAA